MAWAKQHIQTMVGHAFLEVNTGQGPFPIQVWPCITCFFRGKSLSVGTREGFLACGDVTSQTSTYLLLRQNYQRKTLEHPCRYDCMAAFSLVTKKLSSINRNSSNKLQESNQKCALSTRSLLLSGTGHCKGVTVIMSCLYKKSGPVQAGSTNPFCFWSVYSPTVSLPHRATHPQIHERHSPSLQSQLFWHICLDD